MIDNRGARLDEVHPKQTYKVWADGPDEAAALEKLLSALKRYGLLQVTNTERGVAVRVVVSHVDTE